MGLVETTKTTTMRMVETAADRRPQPVRMQDMYRVMQRCGKCGGREFAIPGTLTDGSIEIECVNCGRRRYLSPPGSINATESAE